MAADIQVRSVTAEDVALVAMRMRGPDRDEAAHHHLSPIEGLRQSIAVSLESWTVVIDGVPAAIFGLSPRGALPGGAPWLLATDAFAMGGGLRIGRQARRIVASWSRGMALENYCDTRNTVALRFLEWLGFRIELHKGCVMAKFWMPQGGCR